MSMAMPAHPLPLLVRALVHPERPGGGREHLRAPASARTGRGVGEAVSRWPLSSLVASMCSCVFRVLLVLPPVGFRSGPAANMKASSVVFLSRKEMKYLSLKCSGSWLLVAFLFHFGKLRFDGESNFLSLHVFKDRGSTFCILVPKS